MKSKEFWRYVAQVFIVGIVARLASAAVDYYLNDMREKAYQEGYNDGFDEGADSVLDEEEET